MALTPEQLAAAKAKLLQTAPTTEPSSALSETAAAAKAKLMQSKPTPVQPTEQPQEEQQDGFFKSLIKEPVKALIVKPAVRAAEALAGLGLFGKKVQRGAEMNAAKGTNVDVPLLGNIHVEPVKTGVSGVKQAAGESLESASYLVGGGAAKEAAKGIGKTTAKQFIKEGAKEGLKGGALYGAGEGLQKDKDLAGIAAETAGGAAIGTVFGGAIGGAAGKVSSSIRKRGVNYAVDEAEAVMRDAAGLTKGQAQKEARGIIRSGKTGEVPKNDIRTLAEEGIYWNEKNEGGTLKHDTVGAQKQVQNLIDEAEELYQDSLTKVNPHIRHDLQALKTSAVDNAESFSAQTARELKQKIAEAVDAEIERYGRYVSNSTMNRIKRGMYQRGRYETMAEAGAAYRKAGERIARMLEEANADKLNIKEVNRYLGDLISAQDFLSKLHGGTVRGGGLSRKMAGLAGAMAGRSTRIPIIGELLGYHIGETAQRMAASPERKFAKLRRAFRFGESKGQKVLGRAKQDVAAAEAAREATPRIAGPKTVFGKAPPAKPDQTRLLTQKEIAERNAQMQMEAEQISRRQKAAKTGSAAYLGADDTAIFKGREVNGRTQYYSVAPGHAPVRISPQEVMERKRAGEKIFANATEAKANLLNKQKAKKSGTIEGEVVERREKNPQPETYGFNIDAEDARVRSINRGGELPKVKPVAETLAETVKKIKAGESYGITLNHNGTVYDGKGAIVTLHSKSFTEEEATPRNIADFLNDMRVAYQDHPNVKFGTFPMKDGRVSVDINLATRDRELAKRIATENNQEAYWDYELNDGEGGAVETGGTGESKYTRSQISDALALAKESGFGMTPKETPISEDTLADDLIRSALKLGVHKDARRATAQEAKRIRANTGVGTDNLTLLVDPPKLLKTYREGLKTGEFKDTDDFIKQVVEFEKSHAEEITVGQAMERAAGRGGKIAKDLDDIAVAKREGTFGGTKAKFNEPNAATERLAQQYMKSKGLKSSVIRPVTSIDEAKAKRIADAFEAMKDEPNNPKVKKAYDALAKETKEQYEMLVEAGYKMEPWEGKGQPYKNSAEMVEDVRNKHLYFFKTDEGFGSGVSNDHPLLKESGIVVNGHKMKYNDLFRAVHDIFGHTKLGNQFGAVGEENAWLQHSKMYSDDARRAMTTETRGQNSWVNFGKHLRDKDGNVAKKDAKGFVRPQDRPYSEQKTGLLPDDIVFEGASKDEDLFDVPSAAMNVRKALGIDQTKSAKAFAKSRSEGMRNEMFGKKEELVPIDNSLHRAIANIINRETQGDLQAYEIRSFIKHNFGEGKMSKEEIKGILSRALPEEDADSLADEVIESAKRNGTLRSVFGVKK